MSHRANQLIFAGILWTSPSVPRVIILNTNSVTILTYIWSVTLVLLCKFMEELHAVFVCSYTQFDTLSLSLFTLASTENRSHYKSQESEDLTVGLLLLNKMHCIHLLVLFLLLSSMLSSIQMRIVIHFRISLLDFRPRATCI